MGKKSQVTEENNLIAHVYKVQNYVKLSNTLAKLTRQAGEQ